MAILWLSYGFQTSMPWPWQVLKLGRGHESDVRIADVSISRRGGPEVNLCRNIGASAGLEFGEIGKF